jgi:hypothetical protein
MSLRELTSARGNALLQLFQPVLDYDDLWCSALIDGLLDHEETLAVGRHVIVRLLGRVRIYAARLRLSI